MATEAIRGFRLTQQQKQLWRIQQADPGGAYWTHGVIRISGPLDHAVLQAALQDLVARHEILRTTVQPLAGMTTAAQVIADTLAVALPVQTLPQDDHAAQTAAIAAFVAALQQPAAAPLRLALLQCAPEEHLLLLALPALNADATTVALLLDELSCSYRACRQAAACERAVIQYADVAEWQYTLLAAPEAEAGLAFWRKQAAAAADWQLPFAHTPETQPPYHPAQVSTTLDAAATAQLRALAQRAAVPLDSVVLTGWLVLLARLSGRNEGRIWLAGDGRSYEELTAALGLLTQYLPLSSQLRPQQPFDQLLVGVAAAMQEALQWQEYMTADLLAADPGRATGFAFQPAPAPATDEQVRFMLEGVSADTERLTLTLRCTDQQATLRADVQYDPAFHSAADIERLAAQLDTLLHSIAADSRRPIGELALLSPAERQQVVTEFNQTARPFPATSSLHELFAAQAARSPDAIAVRAGSQSLSYGELERRANQLSQRLQRQGVGPDSLVGLLVERSLDLIVGLLGILKAGGAYLPLDPDYPPARLHVLLGDARVTLVLTQQHLRERLEQSTAELLCLDELADALADEPDAPPTSDISPDNLAYVIYTSGSTGQPKGVAVSHRSVLNLATGLNQALFSGDSSQRRFSLNGSPAFDTSVKQIIQLIYGHTLVILPPELRFDGRALREFLQAEQVDVLDCTPSQLRLLAADGLFAQPDDRPSQVLLGGEAIDAALWQTLRDDQARRFYNLYGPTECTVDATVAPVNAAAPTIGRPLPNMRAYILDTQLQPVPIGVRGELYLSGAGVARGYLHQPAATAERFIPNPFAERDTASADTEAPCSRLYKTGDLARWLPDGTIEYVGRDDDQIKLRGYRIEPGEIAGTLRRHPGVQECVVVAREDVPGDPRLVAYIVPAPSYAPVVEGRPRYQLDNQLAIVHLNKNETDWLYHEVFTARAYLKNGLQLKPGDCIVDVGANLGLFTLFAHQHAPGSTIYAFEPNPFMFELLRTNVALYNVPAQLFQCGLGASTTTAPFTFYPKFSFLSGLYANAEDDKEIVRSFIQAQQRQQQITAAPALEQYRDEVEDLLEDRFQSQTFMVQLRPLSDLIREQQITQIDLLKINVEKSEYEVIAGIRAEDWPKIKQLVIEVHDLDGRLEQLVTLLEQQGYQLVVEQHWSLTSTKDGYYIYASRDPQPNALPTEPAVQFQPPMLTSAELRSFAQATLPDYMLPAAFVLLERLPLTSNGKVDRRALPRPDSQRVGPTAPAAQPRNAVELTIAAIWQRVLQLDSIGIYDTFFDLGGHSLLVLEVHRQLCQELDVDLSVVDVFKYPTISALAQYLTSQASSPALQKDPQAAETRSAARQQRRARRETPRARDN